jgi:hypothetical protein
MWRWRTLSSQITYRSLAISLSKKVIAHSSRDLTAYYRKRDDASSVLFCWTTRYHNAPDRLVCFATNSTCINTLTFKYVSSLLYTELADIQTGSRPIDIQGRAGDRRTAYHVAFDSLDKPSSGGDQKKDGKRLKPVQPTRPKIKKQKREREDDKEKQEENEPRTEGPVFWIMQKAGSV